ncbi:aldehyde dehydrogenase family protein [Natronomonas marina]|jgi:aldehyde dehydrogenase (NAD+)|uniref:aldehyde dehydrogenase family protein n=1 Tax=Natronomonas marina TaxID=2961939 RepID=UPI0020C9E8CD|nr:aldehyde dehydrogenase family protein [Natronomonas marina]
MAQSTPSEAVAPDLDADANWNRLLVGGEWLAPGDRETITVTDPSTRERWGEVPAGTVDDVDDAYDAAVTAQSGWADRSAADRTAAVREVADLLERHEETVTELLVAESGSSRIKSTMEIRTAEADVEEAATLPAQAGGDVRDSTIAGKENLVKREPAGVVAVIPPWNFPLHLAIRAVAPAVALGNAVVVKPASETPVTSGLLVGKLFEAAGVPDGLVNVVTGRGSDIGDRVAGHPDVDVVAFTGSTPVGRRVAKQAVDTLAFPAMELGGNGPNVVLEDADLENAVAGSAFGSFSHQGQVCISINRHLVHESVYDEFVEGLVEKAEMLPTGSAHEPATIVGPIINESQRDSILEYVESTVEAGATLETGGDHDGLVVEPTVLSDATNDMAAACNEHFGPVAPVIPFSDDEEAVELANDTEYGLAASVWSSDRNRAEDVADAIDAGMVHVNDQPINEEPAVPFGGMKASGIGRFHGESIMRELTEEKWISVQREERSFPF